MGAFAFFLAQLVPLNSFSQSRYFENPTLFFFGSSAVISTGKVCPSYNPIDFCAKARHIVMKRPTADKDDSEGRHLRSSLQFAVGNICVEEGSEGSTVRVSAGAVLAISELAYLYATTSLANDLVSFSRHANRRTITADDVLLIARKNPDGLKAKLESFLNDGKHASNRGFGSRSPSNRTGQLLGSSSSSTPSPPTDEGNSKELRERLIREIVDSADETEVPSRKPTSVDVNLVDSEDENDRRNENDQIPNKTVRPKPEVENLWSSSEDEAPVQQRTKRLKKKANFPTKSRKGREPAFCDDSSLEDL